MSGFDDKRRGEEAQFAMSQDNEFKLMARRNKRLGLWTAERLGKSGEDAERYAKTVVLADLEEAGDDDVLRKVAGDLREAGITMSDADIRQQMERILHEVRGEAPKS